MLCRWNGWWGGILKRFYIGLVKRKLIGFDRDEQAIARVEEIEGDPRLSLVHSNFAHMAAMLDDRGGSGRWFIFRSG